MENHMDCESQEKTCSSAYIDLNSFPVDHVLNILLKDKTTKDGKTNILVYASDAPKVDRVMDNLNINVKSIEVRPEIVTETELPPFTYDNIASRAKTVDVIWFNERKMPCRFYEVEHSTNISNSLDKFYELQDFRADFFIIADESRRRQFDSLMERSMYKRIVQYVKFFNYDNLAMQYERECSLASIERL